MFNLTDKKNTSLSFNQKGAVSKGLIIGLVLTLGLIIGIWAFVPKVFSSNEELIGKGTPVVLIMYSGHDSASKNLKSGYKELYKKYQGSIEFMLINIHSPNGIRFLQHTHVESGEALYYNAQGEQILKLVGPKSVSSLDESIKNTFGI